MLLDKEFLEQELKTKTVPEIAASLGTYPNKVRRALINYGLIPPSKSEATKKAMQTGRAKHPTKGKERTTDEKKKISRKMVVTWENLNVEERINRKVAAQKRWNRMTDEEKEEFQRLGHEAVRKAATDGSKLEIHLLLELKLANYGVDFHRHLLTSNGAQHVDLYLPNQRIAIEIDGPTHFLPIWGDAVLARHQMRDHKKEAMLIGEGIKLIRILYLKKHLAEVDKDTVTERVKAAITELKNVKEGCVREIKIGEKAK